MRILLTSGGGFQGQAVIQLFRALPVDVHITVFDSGEVSISSFTADCIVKVPLASDPAYKDLLLEALRADRVDYIIPSSVYDLEVLANLKEAYPNQVLVSSSSALNIFLNKSTTNRFLKQNDIPVLPSLNEGDTGNGKWIAKQDSGFGGKGVQVLTAIDSPERFVENGFLVQEFLSHFREFSIDVLFLNDDWTAPIVRERQSVTGGFAVVSDIQSNMCIDDLLKRLLPIMSSAGAYGFFNIQCVSPDMTSFYVNDINPRIGTSAVFSSFGLADVAQLMGLKSNLPKSENTQGSIFRTLKDTVVPQYDLGAITTIAFDLDDTLINHGAYIRSQFANFVQSLEIAPDIKSRVEIFGLLVIEEHRMDTLLDRLHAAFPELGDFESLLLAYRLARPKELIIYDDVLEILRELKAKGYELRLLTNNPPKSQEYKLSLVPQLSSLFDHMHFAESVGKSKPDSACFKLLTESDNLSHIAYVGDSALRDIYGSLKAGCGFAFHVRREGGILNSRLSSKHSQDFSGRFHCIQNLRELRWYLAK